MWYLIIKYMKIYFEIYLNQFPKMDNLQYTFCWVGEHRLVTPSITTPKQPKNPPQLGNSRYISN